MPWNQAIVTLFLQQRPRKGNCTAQHQWRLTGFVNELPLITTVKIRTWLIAGNPGARVSRFRWSPSRPSPSNRSPSLALLPSRKPSYMPEKRSGWFPGSFHKCNYFTTRLSHHSYSPVGETSSSWRWFSNCATLGSTKGRVATGDSSKQGDKINLGVTSLLVTLLGFISTSRTSIGSENVLDSDTCPRPKDSLGFCVYQRIEFLLQYYQ